MKKQQLFNEVERALENRALTKKTNRKTHMKKQHTPGPWAVSPYNNITSRNGTVAKTEQMPGNYESEQKANAHLIAAAPDLLSALKETIEYLETFACHDEQGRAAIKSANAAISKAEGVK